jgi:high-affinity nickel-transport protein
MNAASIGVIVSILSLHIVGGVTLVATGGPWQPGIRNDTFGLGVGLTAYLLGMRHAFDADHISAIDSTTRKLLQDGKGVAAVGFWFSIGHSSVVVGLSLLLALGIWPIVQPIVNRNSNLHHWADLIGPMVSGGFLFLIAAINIVVLVRVWRVMRHMLRAGEPAQDRYTLTTAGGPVSRLLGRLMNLINEPWQMYVVGALFALGFDTTTEVTLLALAGSKSTPNVTLGALFCLPILFSAGMSLLDTLDGMMMKFVYTGALRGPLHRIYYNLFVTGLSVAVALTIGTLQIGTLLEQRAGVFGSIAQTDFSKLGLAIVALFIAAALTTVAIRSRPFGSAGSEGR